MSVRSQVLVIGGGLSGLTAMHRLQSHGIDCHLVEAAACWGGRILSAESCRQVAGRTASVNADQITLESVDVGPVDLGPAWFWKDQSAIWQLFDLLDLGTTVFEQQHQGLSVLEYGDGALQRVRGSASMAGSYRLQGGMASLVSALVKRIHDHTCHLNQQATELDLSDPESVRVSTRHQRGNETVFEASRVILALPPRVVANTLSFDPACTADELNTMVRIPTWMAGQAKSAVVLKQPVWRDQGLSGDAMSQLGPLAEIHDASPQHGPPYALSGFIGFPVNERRRLGGAIKPLIVQQLKRLFTINDNDILSVHVQDWSLDSLIATDDDWEQRALPTTRPPQLIADSRHRLIWAGSESAPTGGHSCGFMEGAVISAWAAADRVIAETMG